MNRNTAYNPINWFAADVANAKMTSEQMEIVKHAKAMIKQALADAFEAVALVSEEATRISQSNTADHHAAIRVILADMRKIYS